MPVARFVQAVLRRCLFAPARLRQTLLRALDADCFAPDLALIAPPVS